MQITDFIVRYNKNIFIIPFHFISLLFIIIISHFEYNLFKLFTILLTPHSLNSALHLFCYARQGEGAVG